VHPENCEGDQHCWNGDSMGCNIRNAHNAPNFPGTQSGVPGADIDKCITCNCDNLQLGRLGSPRFANPCVGSTPNIEKWWSCCCNATLTFCIDCESPGFPAGPLTRRRCICECLSDAHCASFGTETCKRGFVWREAYAGDRVCVPVASRTRAADDNRHAAERRAGGGPFGPDSCKTGFVWREASPNDHVCVTVQTRADTRAENNLAGQRKRRQRRGDAVVTDL
jgi:hypothetical protein